MKTGWDGVGPEQGGMPEPPGNKKAPSVAKPGAPHTPSISLALKLSLVAFQLRVVILGMSAGQCWECPPTNASKYIIDQPAVALT